MSLEEWLEVVAHIRRYHYYADDVSRYGETCGWCEGRLVEEVSG
jgi:hypothetical protein